ncbi:MFS transporter [Anaerosporomusa subterranea]|uniref:MFS transporter n=1 Tax=Anaerosporomusa subterranea TaxID=1794912 RepID=A0A154BLV9_ANASB|nr:MFS transporter [Anaerosporomusa subterranea]KYZ74967.1 MFS transporter [Anaerosporomusa subterranea]
MKPIKKSRQSPWVLILSAAAILMISMGIRQSTGLFVSPLVMSTGQSIVSISFAFAIGQLVWGAVQPVFGAVADKWGSARVVVFGAVLLAAGMGLTPYVSSEWGLIATVGVISPAGAGAGSFALLFGAIARHIPEERRAFAGGFINAGSSFGQFLFAPLTQALIGTFNWTTAMFSLAAAALFTIPLAAPLRQGEEPHASDQAHVSGGLFQQVTAALRDRSYLCLHAGFFTCGFHVAFLVTHLPGEVALSGHAATVSAASIGIIGLFNIAGSLCAGALGSRYRMKYILAVMYGSRAIMIGLYLLAPKTVLTFYVFAASLGFTWLATVPPTAGLVGKLFGARYLSTLFGLTLLTHQIGGFLGAWLGGIAMANDGNYMWMWYADIVLAAAAALVNLPIREAKVIAK